MAGLEPWGSMCCPGFTGRIHQPKRTHLTHALPPVSQQEAPSQRTCPWPIFSQHGLLTVRTMTKPMAAHCSALAGARNGRALPKRMGINSEFLAQGSLFRKNLPSQLVLNKIKQNPSLPFLFLFESWRKNYAGSFDLPLGGASGQQTHPIWL